LSKTSLSDESKLDKLIKLLANKEELKDPKKLDSILGRMKSLKNP
jgi:hypothetical protein